MNKTKKINNKRIINKPKTYKYKTRKSKTHRYKMRKHKTYKYKIGGGPKVMTPFGSQSSQTLSQPSQPSQEIIKIVQSSGLPETCKIKIISSVDPRASAEDVKHELDMIERANTTLPFSDVSRGNSFEDSGSYEAIMRWADSINASVNPDIRPSISQASIDATQEPLKLDDLKTLTPELDFHEDVPTNGSLSALFSTKFKFDLSPEDATLLGCLSRNNLEEIIKFLTICINNPASISDTVDDTDTPTFDNFNVVVLVHGVINLDRSASPLDMRRTFPKMRLRFAVPESMSLRVNYNLSPTIFGRGYEYIINKAFDKTVFIFDEFGADRANIVHPMLQGTSTSDDRSTQEAMGFFIRLMDQITLFKLADFNCTYAYAKYFDPLTTMKPESANMTLDYSLRFINDLLRLIRNVLRRNTEMPKDRSEDYPNILVTELSCRPYVGIDQIPSRIGQIWQALFTLGETNAAMMEGYATYKTNYGSSVFNVKQQIPTLETLSQTSTLDALPDEESKLNYLIDKIIVLANRILISKCFLIDEDAKETHRIAIIRSIIQYYRKINFAFARAELNVPEGATILNSLDMGPDKTPNEDFNEYLKERVRVSSQGSSSGTLPPASRSQEGYSWGHPPVSPQFPSAASSQVSSERTLPHSESAWSWSSYADTPPQNLSDAITQQHNKREPLFVAQQFPTAARSPNVYNRVPSSPPQQSQTDASSQSSDVGFFADFMYEDPERTRMKEDRRSKRAKLGDPLVLTPAPAPLQKMQVTKTKKLQTRKN